MRWSIAQRLSAMFALAALLVFALLGIGVYGVLERQVVRYQHAELQTKLHAVSGSVAMCDTRERWSKVRDKVGNLISGDRDTLVWAWSDDPIFRIGGERPQVQPPNGNDSGMGTLQREGQHPLRTLYERVPGKGVRPAVDLWIGIDSEPYTHAFNGALDRLEAAYTRLDAFNADVAHELRTPLANLMGQTQVALSRPRDNAQLQDVMQSNLEELERLRAIVNDMLFLSRAGQGDIAMETRPVALADEVAAAGDFLEFLFEEAGLTLRIEGDATASIDPSLFRRALTNLLHNAVQHARPGTEVRVQLQGEDKGARIAVLNEGDGIAAEHLPLLFERFYRVDEAREYRGERHHGLGLSIVKAIAVLHGGDVFVASRDGLTTVGFTVAC